MRFCLFIFVLSRLSAPALIASYLMIPVYVWKMSELYEVGWESKRLPFASLLAMYIPP
jgi:hypothetical protein